MGVKAIVNESEWVSAFREGESLAFKHIYTQHFKPLCYFAIRLTQNEAEAEDIVSECFVKIWKKRSDFNTPEQIKAYLYISCRNVCLTYLRDLNRKTARQALYFDQLENNTNNILHEIIEAEFLQVLDQEIGFLPERCREVFNLVYFEGKKTDEIALELNLSVKTVRNHKARATELLKTAFLKKNITAPLYLAFLLFIDGI